MSGIIIIKVYALSPALLRETTHRPDKQLRGGGGRILAMITRKVYYSGM